ncbi:hypothetical protein [Micromonospora sp. NBC_01412]|uniref:hypothetical protein n=1 Tax=Micromonospora sp. NBC_01412 TaxID=2903590 RepID=UPI003246C702
MKLSDFELQPEDPGNNANLSLRRRITVRHFVIAVTVTATAYLVHRRTDDSLLALASLPAMHGFLCYWLAEGNDARKQPGSW